MITKERLKELLGAMSQRPVMVVGDLMLDRYVSGSVSRISPEAPVPVVLVTGERSTPGGASNVASNIQALGGKAIPVGIVGKDAAGEELMKVLEQRGICPEGVVVCDWMRTTVKTRVIAERQQVVRIDHDYFLEKGSRAAQDLQKRIGKLAPKSQGLIVEDYGKGVVTQELVEKIQKLGQKSKFKIGLDPKDNHDLSFKRMSLATPNYKEACSAAGLKEVPLGKKPISCDNLRKAGAILMEKWNPELLIITLGPHGMYILSAGKKPEVIPTHAREVFDVSGAGDTVIAAAMLALAAGASHVEAASLANYAAGVVVGKLGTATCTPGELVAYVEGA